MSRALSVRQPWAELIFRHQKSGEFRSWEMPSKFVGVPVLIHASSWDSKKAIWGDDLHSGAHREAVTRDRIDVRVGGVIGIVVFGHPEELGQGLWKWPIAWRRRVKFIPCKGSLNFWRVSPDIINQVKILDYDPAALVP